MSFVNTRTLIGRRFGRFFVVLILLLASMTLLVFIPNDYFQQLENIILILFATLGILFLFLWAVGWLVYSNDLSKYSLSYIFMNTLPEGICITDSDDRIIFANPAYKFMIGVDENYDLLSIKTLFRHDPDAIDAIYRLIQFVDVNHQGEEEVRLALPLEKINSVNSELKDFSYQSGYWYSILCQNLQFSEKQGPVKIWRISNITKNRQNQEKIFQELQFAIDYLDHAPVGFFSANPDGRIAYINATLADWIGLDIADIRSGDLHILDLVDETSAAYLVTVDGTLIKPSAEAFDLDLIHSNGQTIPVRLIHHIVNSNNADMGASRTIVLNRSRDEGHADALRAAEVRFSRFFNSSPIAIASITRDRRLGRCNAQFVRLFGHEYGEGSNRDFVDSVDEIDRQQLRAALTAAVNGKSHIDPLDVKLLGEAEQIAKIYISSVEQNDDHEAAILFALDITEQRTLEQQFAQSQKMQAIGQLAGGVAHDFNNMLTAIIGFSDLLLNSHKPSDPSFQDIMNIKQNANRAAGLVRQLLAFSRRQTLRPQVLHLSDVMNEISAMLDRLLGERVSLEVKHGRDLWSVKVDLNQFEQVIMNLAVNARDAMPDGGIVTIQTRNISAREVLEFGYKEIPESEFVLIEVCDTGIGMSPDIVNKVFDPFFTTKDVGQGTGLGLSTVYGIVKQTGGFIYVDSKEQNGTVFRIFLPRYFEDTMGTETIDEIKLEEDSSDLTGSASILLVEDEEAVRSFAARALTSRGYQVYEAMTGAEALEVMKEADDKIDLVISDVVMPEMDGPTLLKELRKTQPELKIIFVSGYAEEAFAKNLRNDETFSFLPKPFSLKQLARAVKEVL